MTGTASSRGRSILELDIHRNQEWLRRRKLRLEQVRKQSNEIAKALRQKVINHEKARLEEYDRLSEAKFIDWKAEKLEELERKLMYALEEFGEGYKLAEAEPDPEEILEERYKIDWAKAQKRGEIAQQEELKRKKTIEENKMAAIERKKLVRKKEDLRSALVLSVPLKKQLLESQKVPDQVYPEKCTSVKKKMISKDCIGPDIKKKMPGNKGKKKVTPQKSCMCKRKRTCETSPLKRGETIWVNLNEIQNSSAGDSGLKYRSSKSSRNHDKNEKPEGTVEFYDFSSRYYCRSFKEFPHLVEKIDSESEVFNANDLATMENEKDRFEVKRKIVADVISQERGIEALKREKINQDYNNLITKLEELNRKEKIIKAQQRKPLSFLHMNDERLLERMKMKQRLMDSKFEGIYYEALSQIPRKVAPQMFNSKGGGDYHDGKSTRLSFTHSAVKPNTPVTSEEDCVLPETRKPRKTKKRQLLIDIDKALREGRELRKSMSRNREASAEEKVEEEKGSSEEEKEEIVAVSPRKDEEKKTKSQESQTEELKTEEVGVEVGGFGKTGDDSLPVSTSTSYRSPPSVIRSYRLRQFLEYLEGVSEVEDNSRPTDAAVSKMDALIHNLYHDRKRQEKDNSNPTLEYYIEKLLNMSREYVADLSVSSENVSTPNITDLEDSKATTPAYFCTVSTKGEELVRKSRLNRAEQLEETIKNWKRILEMDSGERLAEVEDVVDSPHPEPVGSEVEPPEEPAPVICSPKIYFKRYEEITKKCSERISELSNMLEKVRKDKEKLLSSSSGSSRSSSNKDGGNSVEESEAYVEEDKEEEPSRRSSLENPNDFIVEGFLNRYDSPTGKESISTTAVVDSQSCPDQEQSLESWPDVMSELLRRKIITSPFKWSEGEFSSEFTDNQTKPSSIETVIGNFRKEISKIKAFNLSDSFPQSTSSARSQASDENQLLCSPKKRSVPSLAEDRELSVRERQEESSVESINHALSTLGLNWARSFLRKNEESKAMSSSSEGKSSDNEADD